MKKMVKAILALCFLLALLVCLPQGVSAAEGTYGKLKYQIIDRKVTITGCSTSLSGDLTIPSEIEGYPVTAIAEKAFANNSKITSVTFSKSVTTIGADAFLNCKGIESVYISDLTAWCRIKFSNSKSNPMHYAKKIYFNGELLTDLEIPGSINTIENYAFYNCTSLKTVIFPSSVSRIRSNAFNNCTGLTEVTFLQTIFDIEVYAFSDCKNLKNVRYSGRESNRKGIKIFGGNEYITNATWEYLYHKAHAYNNACDPDCNICQEIRVPSDHVYSYDCDATCNVCMELRTPAPHIYTNDCDALCNICGVRRWNTTSHQYDNTCDQVCNICEYTREITHTYDGFWDEKCNVCLEVRETLQTGPQTYSKDVQLTLKVSFCGISQSFHIKMPGTVMAIVVIVMVAVGGVAVYVVRQMDKKKFT